MINGGDELMAGSGEARFSLWLSGFSHPSCLKETLQLHSGSNDLKKEGQRECIALPKGLLLSLFSNSKF